MLIQSTLTDVKCIRMNQTVQMKSAKSAPFEPDLRRSTAPQRSKSPWREAGGQKQEEEEDRLVHHRGPFPREIDTLGFFSWS
jgi:hypothetical protein